MNSVCSVIHATLGRPDKAMATRKLWMERAGVPDAVEYIFVVNIGDETGEQLTMRGQNEKIIWADVKYSAPAWNVGATAATGELFVQGQDDVEPPHGWDVQLYNLCRLHGGRDTPLFIGVGDGYRKGEAAALCCTAIMTRAYRDLEGCFLYPGYRSVFSDDEATYRALRHDRDGEAKFIHAKDLTFLHRHHYHDKTVPWDQTYAHENDPAAYSLGQRLFLERNPRALTDGLKRW